MLLPVLIVHPDGSTRSRLARAVHSAGYEPVEGADVDTALAQLLPGRTPVAALAGAPRPALSSDVAARVREEVPGAPIIAVGDGAMDDTVASLRLGIQDYVPESRGAEAVAAALERVLQRRAAREHLDAPVDDGTEEAGSETLVGEHRSMREVRGNLHDLAGADTTVLIRGETGTGKEVVGRLLHELSPRREGPFVALNCAAIPHELLESELFGHERGAFTGAQQGREGLLARADGGTVLLDEVGALPPMLQPKLLRALEERTVRAVGSDRERPFDAHIIAATNSDLSLEVEAGRFRADLYYRLNVVEIVLPPLRERGLDVLVLARHLLHREAQRRDKPIVGMTPAAADALMSHDWPGNVRELENAIEAAVSVARFDRIRRSDLPPRLRERPERRADDGALDDAELVPLDALECSHIAEVLREVEGNKSEAARVLGIDRKTLYRKLGQYGLGDLEARERSTARLQALQGLEPDSTARDS